MSLQIADLEKYIREHGIDRATAVATFCNLEVFPMYFRSKETFEGNLTFHCGKDLARDIAHLLNKRQFVIVNKLSEEPYIQSEYKLYNMDICIDAAEPYEWWIDDAKN